MFFLVLTSVLLFIAFLLLLLVSLSVPIIKSIYLFRFTISATLLRSGVVGAINFGVWGSCSPALTASKLEDLIGIITKTITGVLILHPIACALTFLALLITLFMLRRGSSQTSRLPMFFTLGTALLTTVVFLIDVIVISVTRRRINSLAADKVILEYGNAIWMTGGAALGTWFAMVGIWIGRRSR
ncbi:hypothetical protein L218DRAFT_1019255 [Marasmius fiardii PR-910]|nr:hypothetical protein L218DRAFT_1019255 [Marasmius fiardii PR-910]